MSMSLNRQVLVVNASYEPVNVTSARRAMTLLSKEAAVKEKLSGYSIRTPSGEYSIPTVIRLKHYRRIPRINRTVSRKGVLLRDGYVCQYCGKKFPVGELTLDHVIPSSKGGEFSWENLVCCCFPCNNQKKDRTPEETGMTLLRRPVRLLVHSKHRLLAGNSQDWNEYLFA